MRPIKRVFYALLFVLSLVASLVIPSGVAGATSDYDDLLQVSPTLTVYTDGAAKTQKMDISATWWSEFKQTYAKRVEQNIGWPANFVSEFEAIMSSGGSWGVYTTEISHGKMVSIVGTHDPNAYCGFVGSAGLGSYECTSNPGYGYVRADYYTHNSFGGNGCIGSYGDRCSDTGMNVYQAPTIVSDTAGYTFLSIVNEALSNRQFFFMNFNLQYPSGYEGELIPTGPPAAKSVAMGDSYTSGEGNPPFEAGTDVGGENECHRSPRAYVRLLQSRMDLGPTKVVACAGATTANITGSQWNQPAQTSALTGETEKVILTIGGNDVGFSSYVLGCVVVCGPGTPIYDAMMDGINQPAFKANLVFAFEEVLEAAPSADLYVADYPYLADEDVNACWGLDFSGAYEVQTALNGVINDAVAEVALSSSRIHMVKTNYPGSPFEAGRLCGSGGGSSMFNGLVPPPNVEYSLHPNPDGHGGYADVFEEAMS